MGKVLPSRDPAFAGMTLGRAPGAPRRTPNFAGKARLALRPDAGIEPADRRSLFAGVAELVDALDLGSSKDHNSV